MLFHSLSVCQTVKGDWVAYLNGSRSLNEV